MTEDRIDEIATELNKLVMAKESYNAGYRAGYNAAKREVFTHMKSWLSGKDDDTNGKDKDHEKALR